MTMITAVLAHFGISRSQGGIFHLTCVQSKDPLYFRVEFVTQQLCRITWKRWRRHVVDKLFLWSVLVENQESASFMGTNLQIWNQRAVWQKSDVYTCAFFVCCRYKAKIEEFSQRTYLCLPGKKRAGFWRKLRWFCKTNNLIGLVFIPRN